VGDSPGTAAPGDLVAGVTRVTLGGGELPGVTLWARADYAQDGAHLTALFTSQGPRWQRGARAVLAVARRGGGVHEIPVQIEQEEWHGDEQRTAQLRLRILGATPWSEAEALLAPPEPPEPTGLSEPPGPAGATETAGATESLGA
jgi:hypothetical protein